MKKVTGKLMSLLLIMALLTLTVTGCGNKKEEGEAETVRESVSVENTESTGNEESQNTDETQESGFDFSQVFDNIEVNGKKVPFPFTLNDLGEDFSVDSIVEMGDGTCGATLYYDGYITAGIFMNIDKKEYFNKDTKIFRVDLGNSYMQYIKINGTDCNSSVDEVKKNFNGLKEKYNNEGNLSFMEVYQNNNYISYYFEDNLVSSIYVCKGE